LLAASYFGGSGFEYQPDLAVDRQGNVIIAGETRSDDLPTTPGVIQQKFGGEVDWFAAKLSPDLKRLVWCTYFGGPGYDATGWETVLVDSEDNVLLFGLGKDGGPRSENGWNAGSKSEQDPGDIVIAKLLPDASALVYRSRFGGSGQDQITGARLLADGSLLLAGMTSSTDFPFPEKTTRVGPLGETDCFLTSLKADGSGLEGMTLFGGENSDFPERPLVCDDGSIVVAGETWSHNFPTTPGAHQRFFGGTTDGFVARIAGPGGALLSATTFGGGDRESAAAAAIGPDGRVWIAGHAGTPEWQLTGDALQFYGGGEIDGLLASMAPDGSRFEFSTFLGGLDREGISDFAFGAGGEIYVVGSTTSTEFATTAFEGKTGTRSDGYVLKLVPTRPMADTRVSRR
jgi:hypothetical protein